MKWQRASLLHIQIDELIKYSEKKDFPFPIPEVKFHGVAKFQIERFLLWNDYMISPQKCLGKAPKQTIKANHH